jgi:SAM-dependent methyltransferase
MDKQTQKELLEIVKRNYEEIADDFCETRKKKLWPELIKIAEIVKENKKILDIGCGNGRLVEAFNNKKIEYLGIDNSEELIKKAKELHRDCVFKIGNILNLGAIPEHDFDYIFCVAVLHHIPGSNQQIFAVKQLKNKLKPEGKIILVVWNLWTHKKFRKLIYKYFLLKLIKKNKMDFGDILFDWKNNQGEIVSQRYYHAFKARELKKIFKKAGLKIEKIYKDQYNYYAILSK